MTTSRQYYLRQQRMQVAGYKAQATRLWRAIASAPNAKALELLVQYQAVQAKLVEFAR